MPLQKNKTLPKRPRLDDLYYFGFQRYFITINTYNNTSVFIKNDKIFNCCRELLRKIADENKFAIWVYCFMPDHLHLLLEGRDEKSDLQKFIKNFKQMSSYQYKKITDQKLWATSYYDHILRKDEDTIEVIKYILNNPVRKGLVKIFTDYPYLGSFVLDIKDLL